MKWLFYTIVFVTGCTAVATARAAPGDIVLHIMANPTGIFPDPVTNKIQSTLGVQVGEGGQSDFVEVGHAFMCIALHLNTGIKEDCYGFYPANAQGQARIVGTALSNEFKVDKMNRFSNIIVSTQRVITSGQRKNVLDVVVGWNDKTWAISSPNCIDFVHDVARAAGMTTPQRSLFQTPVAYLTELNRLNP